MKNIIDIEAEVLGTETRKVRNWFNTLASVLWTAVMVVTFPVRALLRPVTRRVVGFVAPRIEALRQRHIVVNIAQGLGLTVLAWLAWLMTMHIAYVAGADLEGFHKETGKRTAYWAKQTTKAALDGETVAAARCGFNYLTNAERPNMAVRAGSAIGHFFK
jgi:hypothetical protein